MLKQSWQGRLKATENHETHNVYMNFTKHISKYLLYIKLSKNVYQPRFFGSRKYLLSLSLK